MLEDVQHNLMNIWATALELVEAGHNDELIELSNHTIHDASIFNDEFSITAALIVYALGKIAKRGKLDVGAVCSFITRLMLDLWKDTDKPYRDIQKAFLEYINATDTKFSLYVDKVLTEARIKKGLKVYEHGLSMGAVSELVGISQWDMVGYIGNTKVSDTGSFKTDVRSRLEYARGLFS
jgi:hypothetical protein